MGRRGVRFRFSSRSVGVKLSLLSFQETSEPDLNTETWKLLSWNLKPDTRNLKP